ncbi:hypothetical protein N7447_009335 [Penicillium robsamsonii]|uniref:uncharacterized protein n=1 Tax=Penicillium robsamsonii TaxID=1792511 RepID=UPI002548E15C|nr:uncharacterized protein N7447_009335 [Penicillium robsamsonii]KAJ5817102.1 hypothetical protein N7447_009335 [Penicillium robsamsonii]
MPLDITLGEPGEEMKNNTSNNDNYHHHHHSLIGRGCRQPIDWQEDGPLEPAPARFERQGRTQIRKDSPYTDKRRSSFHRQQLKHASSLENESDLSETDCRFTDKRRHLISSVQSPRDINTLPTEASHSHEQATLSSSSQKDVTLHFNLDFVDDIEGHLEELARLKRLGHFHDAVDYFNFNLQQHLNLPLVMIEYADLLQEQGAYRKLLDLQSRGTLKMSQKMDPNHTPELYSWHLDIIQKCAKSAFEGLSKRDICEGTTPQVLEHVEQWLSLQLSDYLDQKPAEPVDWTEVRAP